MKNWVRILVLLSLSFVSLLGQAQGTPAYRVMLPENISANRSFPVVVTSLGACRYPYPQSEQPPDFEQIGNRLEMTVYLRGFGDNIVPTPPCINRTQTYTAPALQSGNYELILVSRFYNDLFNTFGARLSQGNLSFEVASAVPVTQIPATSGWSIALLLLGMMGLARWVSGQSGR
jgi:hypothetical protein